MDCFRHDGTLEEVGLDSALEWGVEALSLGALCAYRERTDFVPLVCSPAADDDLQLKGRPSDLTITVEPSSDVGGSLSLFADMDFIADEGSGTFPLPEYNFKKDFTVPGSAPGFPLGVLNPSSGSILGC